MCHAPGVCYSFRRPIHGSFRSQTPSSRGRCIADLHFFTPAIINLSTVHNFGRLKKEFINGAWQGECGNVTMPPFSRPVPRASFLSSSLTLFRWIRTGSLVNSGCELLGLYAKVPFRDRSDRISSGNLLRGASRGLIRIVCQHNGNLPTVKSPSHPTWESLRTLAAREGKIGFMLIQDSELSLRSI